MPSKFHHDLLVEAINDYSLRGYRLLMLNRNLTENYRPDAVVENEEEMVIIEAVVTSDRAQSMEDLQTFFSKPLRIDKRVKKLKRANSSNEETKSKVLKVFEDAYPRDLSIVEASGSAGISDPTGAMYVRILEAEGKIEFTRNVGRAKMFKLKSTKG